MFRTKKLKNSGSFIYSYNAVIVKILLVIFSVVLFVGCKTENKQNAVISDEMRLCDSLKIDTTLITELRKITQVPIERFHYAFQTIYSNGEVKEIDPLELPGLIFKETAENAELIMDALHSDFLKKGYYLFILDKNFGLNGKPDIMALLHTCDKYELLSELQTDGINYDITNDSLLNLIRVLDNEYELDLIGAGNDWCEFIINKEPVDWMKLSHECYRISPDVVNQGVGTVEALAHGMQQTKRLYLWWD